MLATAALKCRDFRLLFVGVVVSNIGLQMQGTAIGWELYDRTHSAYALGFVGLIALIPLLALALPAGHIIDTHDRRRVLMMSLAIFTAASIGLALVSRTHGPLAALYGCVLLTGVARAFHTPARNALLPELVPPAPRDEASGRRALVVRSAP